MRQQNLKVTDKEKSGTVLGSTNATSVALNFKILQVIPMGCEIHQSHKGKQQNIHKAT